jgi:hypothetical protein
MGNIDIEPGEIETLADPSKGQASRYRIFVQNTSNFSSKVRLADRRTKARTGTEILGGEQVQVELEDGDVLAAFNPTDATVTVEINPQGLSLIDRSTVIQNASIQTDQVGLAKNNTLQNLATNSTGITTGQDTGGGTLPSNSVDPGRSVRVQALSGNSGLVEVNGDFELAAGQAVDLQVTNTDKISYTAASSDGVCFIVEA